MFTPRGFHPYKPPTPRSSPAGLRIVDYLSPRRCFNILQGADVVNMCSPDLSPLSNPEEGTPPALRTANLFAANDLRSTLHRPSTAPPGVHLKAFPQDVAPGQDPQSTPPPRRKANRGPKHLSLYRGASRSGEIPAHRRAKHAAEKRDLVRRRTLDRHRHERRVLRARQSFSKLVREAEVLMKPERMNAEDRIFVDQLTKLKLEQALIDDLDKYRQQMARASAEAPQRQKEHAQRDREAAKMWGPRQDAEAAEAQKRMVEAFVREKEERRAARFQRMEEAAMRADEQRQRMHDALEREIRERQERYFREELARKAKEDEERRRREEEERRLREQRERQLLEEMQRRLREEREREVRKAAERRLRVEQARRMREEREFQFREYQERFMREERARRAREEQERQAEQARRAEEEQRTAQHFALYEGKWNELRTSDSLPPIEVREMPWPVFGVVSSAEQITYHDVRTFLFHPQRPGVEGKSARDKVKTEVLRFHPDKFNTRILPKVHPAQQAVAQAVADAVARVLTGIMTEEAEQQT